MDINEEVKKRKKENWIEVWFAIEALAVDKKIVESALKKHVEKLSKAMDTFIYEKKFSDIKKVENPMKDVKEGYSQVVEVKLFVKNLFSLISITLLYGPSSIEILGPKNKEIKLDEIQSICNILAGIVHQFASVGVGGIVITPDKS